ncbi:hypothetical protein RBE51_17720 [Pseudomonas taiwanensis]|uniref:hypothetical protein n=1 Tax=Pseudomonas taiwanensis TaxID=470150 RepID=UPI0028E03FBE|nr:hypothetical protein [Pseudomonas taiwanensis]MDT8924649.1 hypothetical protein [Pseudomonas taiwanensis]
MTTKAEAQARLQKIKDTHEEVYVANRALEAITAISAILDDYGSLGGFFTTLNLRSSKQKNEAYRFVALSFEQATSVDHGEHNRFMGELRGLKSNALKNIQAQERHEFYAYLTDRYKTENPRTVSGTPAALWDETGTLIRDPSIFAEFQKENIHHQAGHFFNRNPSAWINACASFQSMDEADRKEISRLFLQIQAYKHVPANDDRRLALRPYIDVKAELAETMETMDLRNTMNRASQDELKSRIVNFIEIAKHEGEVDLAKDLIKENLLITFKRNPGAAQHRSSTEVYMSLLDAYEGIGGDLQPLKHEIFHSDHNPELSPLEVMIDQLNPSQEGQLAEATGSNVIAGAFFEKLGKADLLEADLNPERLLKAYAYTKSNMLRDRIMDTEVVDELLAMDLGL